MKKNLFFICWYTIALAAAVFTLTILATVQGASPKLWVITAGFGLLQLAGLVYFLHHDPKKKASRLLNLVQLSTVGTAALLCASLYVLASQYHNPVVPTAPEAVCENCAVEQTDLLYIFYPEYDSVRFVTENRPSRRDPRITFCGAATFQKAFSLSYDPGELPGVYVTDGGMNRGYELKGLGAFVYYDGQYRIVNKDQAEEALKTAMERGGSGFQQFMVMENFEIVNEPSREFRCFRVLAELNGRLCVIDSRAQIKFHDFAAALKELGVKNALYMDMGGGWNYSWYRDNKGKTVTLIGLFWPFSHNWLTFVKDTEN